MCGLAFQGVKLGLEPHISLLNTKHKGNDSLRDTTQNTQFGTNLEQFIHQIGPTGNRNWDFHIRNRGRRGRRMKALLRVNKVKNMCQDRGSFQVCGLCLPRRENGVISCKEVNMCK